MQPGDQHLPQNDKSGQSNPFTPQTTSITRMSAQEIATLQAKLDRQLGPEYISDRPGAGGAKVHYMEAWKCINLANEIFGFNGWSSSIQNISVDYMDENRETGRVSLGLSVVVRVTLKDGVYHEDIGYGSIDNARSKAAAFEKCKKEGTTDALKRALRNFGNVLGNCLYDKSYLREISKVKPPAPRFNLNELHRRPEFAFAVTGLAHPIPAIEKPCKDTTPLVDKPGGDDNIFQDQFDDDYFDDYDFEDRPPLAESPRLNEFDSNMLRTRRPTAIALAQGSNKTVATSNVSHQQNHQLLNVKLSQVLAQAPVQVPAQKTPSPIAVNNPTASPAWNPVQDKPVRQAPDVHLHTIPQDTAQQQVESLPAEGQQPPNLAGFSLLAKDGTPRPYDPRSSFSPLARTNSNGIDYTKSIPIPRTKVQKRPLNVSDAHNIMAQGPAGFNQDNRMIGCPPNHTFSPHKVGSHIRANSGSIQAGVKRNFTVNQGQNPDAKRARN